MINANQIKPETPVVCSKDNQFGVVDRMQGSDTIKLNKEKSGLLHYIPLSWITSIEDSKVKVDRPGYVAMQEWSATPPHY